MLLLVTEVFDALNSSRETKHGSIQSFCSFESIFAAKMARILHTGIRCPSWRDESTSLLAKLKVDGSQRGPTVFAAFTKASNAAVTSNKPISNDYLIKLV